MRKSAVLVVVLGLSLAGVAALGAEHTKDSLETVRRALADKKAILLDVREQAEWNEGHLRDAKLLPLSVLNEGADAQTLAQVLSKDKIIYAHCRSGRRCLQAADILRKQGYEVRPLKAGYPELLDAGFPRASK
jgi:phage shock protein E